MLAPNAKVRSIVVPPREKRGTVASVAELKPTEQAAPGACDTRRAANDDLGIAARDRHPAVATETAQAPGTARTAERQIRTAPLQLAKRMNAPPRDPDERRPDRRLMERINWADLLRRIYNVEALRCPKCRGRLSFIAVVTERASIARILAHLGESPSGPPPVRTVDPWAA